jgi:hypothetical protein
MRFVVQNCARVLALAASALFLVACGNGGSIQFQPSPVPAPLNRGAAITMVPASEALAIESGKTTANGYHAKVQLNFTKGTTAAAGAYDVQLKHTVRNR